MSFWELIGQELRFQLGIAPQRILAVVLASVGIYLAFMILVKLFGSRVLVSMTASDAVIIIMFGAVAGRVIVGNPPTLASGVIGLTVLMILEAAFGTVRRYVAWSKFIDRSPVLLVYNGRMIAENQTYSHVTDSDIYSAVRKAGYGRLADVQVMILEPAGHLSVIGMDKQLNAKVFKGVRGAEKYILTDSGPDHRKRPPQKDI